MCELILFITQYYAWFNSTCYHPPLPGPTPGFAFFFLTWQSIPHPRAHRLRDDSPTPGLLIDHKYVVLCTKPE